MTIPTSPASSIAGIVVAAGLSSRMGHGTSKLLLPWTQDGRTIVETTVGVLLASVVDQVLIVVGYDRQRLLGTLESLPICPVINEEFRSGLSTSIVRGIEAAGIPSLGFLIALADMPTVEASTIDALCGEIARAGTAAIAVPVNGGRRGHPVVFGRDHREGLLALTGDRGARHVVEANADQVREVLVDDDGIFADIDTPEAYAEARRKA